jgi:hypothetical protein
MVLSIHETKGSLLSFIPNQCVKGLIKLINLINLINYQIIIN